MSDLCQRHGGSGFSLFAECPECRRDRLIEEQTETASRDARAARDAAEARHRESLQAAERASDRAAAFASEAEDRAREDREHARWEAEQASEERRRQREDDEWRLSEERAEEEVREERRREEAEAHAARLESIEQSIRETAARKDDILAEEQVKKAKLLVSAGLHSDAVPLLQRAQALVPTDVDIRISLGECLAATGRGNEAKAQLEAAVRLICATTSSPFVRKRLFPVLLNVMQGGASPLLRDLCTNDAYWVLLGQCDGFAAYDPGLAADVDAARARKAEADRLAARQAEAAAVLKAEEDRKAAERLARTRAEQEAAEAEREREAAAARAQRAAQEEERRAAQQAAEEIARRARAQADLRRKVGAMLGFCVPVIGVVFGIWVGDGTANKVVGTIIWGAVGLGLGAALRWGMARSVVLGGVVIALIVAALLVGVVRAKTERSQQQRGTSSSAAEPAAPVVPAKRVELPDSPSTKPSKPTPVAKRTPGRASPRAVIDAEHAALRRGDLGALAELAPSTFAFGVDATDAATDRAAIAAQLRANLGAPPRAGYSITPSQLSIGETADAAWTSERLRVRSSSTVRDFVITQYLRREPAEPVWNVVAWHWSVPVPDAIAEQLAAAETLPPPKAFTPLHATADPLREAREALDTRDLFANSVSNRSDAVNLGTAGERMVGGAVIARVFRKFPADLRILDGIRMAGDELGYPTAGTSNFTAANIEVKLARESGELTQRFRVLLVWLAEPMGWRIVQAHWSIGGPIPPAPR